MKWVNVTNHFSEKQRHYSNTYLEIDEVLDEVVEVSLFSSKVSSYEIYVSFGIMYGIVYVEEEKAYALFEEIKNVVEKEYKAHKEPSDEFMSEFIEKYHICIPNDIFFNADIFDMLQ